jgi:WD40 repeat protein
MDEIFMCEYIGCNRYFDKPVLLPCGNSICQEHVQKMKMLNCQFCGDLHVVPKAGFELNKNFIDIMNLNLHLNESQKAVKYSLKLLENVVEEFHTITHSLEAYLFEYIIAIKNKINMEMQNLREDSGFFEQEMIGLIREYDNECKNNLISLKNLNDLNNLEYENLKSDLNQFYQELRAPKLDKRRLNELLIEVNDKIKEYQMIIKNYKTDIINNTIESSGTSDDPSFPISVVSQFNFKFSENFGELVQSLHGHTEGVRDVKLWTNDRIISASSDRSIKIWNAFTGECVGTLLGHKNAVICIQLLSNNRLVSGSWDSTIKIWDLNKQKCLLTLKGHKSFISCLCLFRNDLLISGSGKDAFLFFKLFLSKYNLV